MNIVRVRGRPYSVNPISKSLSLRGKGLKEISEFKGLENPNLEKLWICDNPLPREAIDEINKKYFKDIY